MSELRRLPIVIDTDVDIDDWMAMLYLVNHPKVDVRGITVVGTGACHLDPGTRNALDLMMLAGQPEMPVAQGLDQPMAYDHQFPADIREPVDDLYGLTLPENPNEPLPDAVAFLEQTLEEADEKIAILAIGPLTNLGTLLRDRPDLASKIERVYVMGGAVDVPGNVHAADPSIPNVVSEWNVYLDPVSADVVFRSGAPVTLVPLDATRFVPVTEEFYTRILKNRLTPSANFIYEALTQDFAFLESGAFYFWDPTAAVLATHPDIGESRDMTLAVHTEDDDRSGQLLDTDDGSEIEVCFEVDGPSFDDLFLEGLNGRKTYKSEITFVLDGETLTLQDVSPQTLLIDFLHDQDVNRQGTKLSCGEGGCGACTVMMTSWDPGTESLQRRAINSCLRPLCTLDGTTLTTTQGLGSVKTTLDPVQHTLAANNGSQCGYCSPGFVMNMYSLLQNERHPTEKQIEDTFDGNICRCTGYRPILAGFKKFACDYEPPPDEPEIVIDPEYDAPVRPLTESEPPADFLPYMRDPQPVSLAAEGYSYYRPVSLDEVYTLKAQYGGSSTDFKLLVGNTQIGIFKTRAIYEEEPVDPKVLVDVSRVPQLHGTRIGDERLTVGGAVSLTRLVELLDDALEELPREQTRGLEALKKHVLQVANTQVRNVASLAGNLYMAVNFGFLSDLWLVLGALGATVTVSSSGGRDVYPALELPEDGDLPKDALYESIQIPYTRAGDHVQTFKIRKRVDDCHAIVNAGFRVRIEDGQVAEARLVYNGIHAEYGADAAPHGAVPFTPITLPETEELLLGRAWNEDTLEEALKSLSDEVAAYAPPKGPGGRPLRIDNVPFAYRESLARTLFYKFYVHVAEEIDPGEVGPGVKSAGTGLERPVSGGVQTYNSYPEEEPVSLPFVKLSAFMQASGEAVYSHDTVLPPGTLEAAYVYSLIPRGTFHYVLPVTTAHGKRGERIDSARLEAFLESWFPGVAGYVAYADVPNPAGNWIGEANDDPVFVPSEDDEIPQSILDEEDDNFHPREITTIGAPLGLVLAADRETAREAADFVRNRCIRWNRKTAVLDLDQAIEEESFYEQDPPTAPYWTHIPEITRPGSDERFLAEPDETREIDGVPVRVVSGVQRTSYQNHFYMETMGTVAEPGEDRTITLHTSTQTLADNQSFAASILDLDSNDVRVVLKRDGGAFGGKQSRSRFNSTAAAVAAYTRRVPVKLDLDRNTNMIMCGNRHAFEGRYHAAFDEKGIVRGLKVDFYSDGGNTYDLSFPVMDLALLNGDNAYRVDNFRVTGKVCQTNTLSNTAFRSFGTIQSVNITEEVFERVAHELGMRPDEVRERNLYENGHPEWTAFQITDLTLAVLRSYGDTFPEDVIEQLAELEGRRFESRKVFEKTVQDISGIFDVQANMLTLEEYSNTSYDFTPYLQGLKYCDIRKVWNAVKESSDFDRRVREVEEFNARNRTKKRGLAMIPLKYGVSYTGPRGTLNQGGAYVIAYAHDGSVLVQHGGVESGQGIQTKMAQIAAETLDIPIEYIRMGETDTNVISDASPTAASTGSDLNGGAVQKACLQLRERLETFCDDLGQYVDYYIHFDPVDMDRETKVQVDTVVRNWRDRWGEVWPTIVSLAYANRIDLAAQARYQTPHYLAVDLAHPFGTPFFYYTYGAAAAEVEVDCLTGEWDLRRADVTFDVGKSLNPLLDVGQMEGGFVQGVGCVTTEEMLFQRSDEAPKKGFPEGALTSYGTWDYKPPGAKTIPVDFRVTLVDNSGFEVAHKGPRRDAAAVKSSKGIGEPPLVLANAAFFAIKRAIAAYRKENGHDDWFRLDAPATVARIQEACRVEDLKLS